MTDAERASDRKLTRLRRRFRSRPPPIEQATAYRKDLLDVVPGCFAVFYGVRRA